jgi:hypothetical protein
MSLRHYAKRRIHNYAIYIIRQDGLVVRSIVLPLILYVVYIVVATSTQRGATLPQIFYSGFHMLYKVFSHPGGKSASYYSCLMNKNTQWPNNTYMAHYYNECNIIMYGCMWLYGCMADKGMRGTCQASNIHYKTDTTQSLARHIITTKTC